MANIEGIQITLGELTQVASTIRTLNTNLNSCLEEIQRKMNALSESWSSEASETIRAKFTSTASHFEEYRAVIDSYAKFWTKLQRHMILLKLQLIVRLNCSNKKEEIFDNPDKLICPDC